MKPNDSMFDEVPPMSDDDVGVVATESDASLVAWDAMADMPPMDDENEVSSMAASMAMDAVEMPVVHETPKAPGEPEMTKAPKAHEPTQAIDPVDGAKASDGVTPAFDVVTASLTTPTLLEASAGTGKTFSIKHLVLRLIVEEKMPIEKLLVVTFTRAATAELKTRIRDHLSEMLGFLTGHLRDSDVDSMIVTQAARWIDEGRDQAEAVKRLRAAMASFDDASISTIHGFCQRTLTNHVFTSSGYFDREYSDDDLPLRQQVVEDFLRRALANAPTDEVRREIMMGVDWEKKLETLTAIPAALAPRQINIEDADPCVLPVLEAFVQEAPQALRDLKRSTRTGTFDDLLSDLWWALQNDTDGKFAQSIREAYRGVLIDEFQDTDPVQFEIFNQLFLQIPENEEALNASRALFFVGDPKQAIYSFRSADLDTYMRAKALIRHHARLEKNFRSCPKLMNAVNAFFKHPTESAFLRHDLGYEPVKTNSKVYGLFELIDGVWQEAPALEWWTSYYGVDDIGVVTAETIADDIARLIAKGRYKQMGLAAGPHDEVIGSVEVDGVTVPLRAVMPGDIAILIQKREHVTAIRKALAQRQVRVAMRSQGDVFQTEEAEEIVRLLHAFESPSNEKVMAAARTTRFLGDKLSDILTDDEARRTALRLAFEKGVERWRRAGVAAAFAYLFETQNVAERLLPIEEGEARLVNYAHILELLHEAGRQYTTPSSLLAWFEQVRASSTSTPEDRRLRLASDANLVTVETIHASKGLQYPIVYLPHAEKLNTKAQNKDLLYKESTPQGMTIRLGHKTLTETSAHFSKRLEEKVRLAYVGMTRAVSHLVVVAPQKANKGTLSVEGTDLVKWGLSEAPRVWAKTWLENAFFMAINGSAKINQKAVIERLQTLAAEEPGFVIVDINEKLSRRTSLSANPVTHTLKDFDYDEPKPIQPSWRISSFSSINRTVTDDDMAIGWYGSKKKPAKLTGIMGFPRGTKAGDCLHNMLEVADFTEIAPDTPQANDVRRRIAQRMIEAFLSFDDDAAREEAISAASQMLYDVVNAEILPGIYLRDVPMSARSSEMPFLLHLREGLTTEVLKATLAEFGPDYAVDGMADNELAGYLTGFIDLAFGAKGKFWILDWKSNAITRSVSAPEDFTQPVMADEMTVHHYRLQYLIYLVALRRFLKVRLGDAFSSALIGGACYVFLRGVSATATREGNHIQGVVYDPVPAEWIERLDKLFL